MRFSTIFSGLAMAATAIATATPQQIATGIQSLTQKSQALQPIAQSITLLNSPLIVIGQGPFPQIIAGFQDIVSTANTLESLITAPARRDAPAERVHARDVQARDVDADLVFNAFLEFVRVHQTLLNILIGKAGILTSVPLVGQPVATVLRSVEAVVDQVAISLIGLFQARAGDLTVQANSLDATIALTIQKYDGLQL